MECSLLCTPHSLPSEREGSPTDGISIDKLALLAKDFDTRLEIAGACRERGFGAVPKTFTYNRGKFRSNMDRWKKAEMRTVRVEKRRAEERRSEKRKSQKREDAGALKGSTVFFQLYVAPEGRKVGSLKRRMRSHLAR